MSDSDQEKTEDPTGRKLEKARSQGDVPKSQEVSSWFAIASMAIIMSFFLPSVASGMGAIMASLLANAHDYPLDLHQLVESMLELTLSLLAILGLPALMLYLSALLSGIVQTNGFLFSTEQLKPNINKLSPKKGLKKIFGLQSVVEFGKGLVKIFVVALVVAFLVWPERDQVLGLVSVEIPIMAEVLRVAVLKVIVAVLAVLTVIAILDVVYQRYSHNKKLRMSKQEVKRETKDTEGDPKVKGRIRRIRVERAKHRIMAAVPEADVVVTNPTHYAVALKYDQMVMEAPRLIAKGADELALKIRELAKEHDIPLVENPPLARAIYSGVEIDQEVPQEHYKAVAEVIGYVMRLHGKLRSEQAQAERAVEMRRRARK